MLKQARRFNAPRVPLIPKSPLMRLFNVLRVVSRNIHETQTIPSFLYRLPLVFLLCQQFIPAFLPVCPGLWRADRSSSRILRVVAFCAFGPSLWEGQTAMIVGFAVVAAIGTAQVGGVLLLGFIFSRTGRATVWLMRAESLLMDILIPVFSAIAWAQIGLCVSVLIKDGWDALAFAEMLLIGAVGSVVFAIASLCWFVEVCYRPKSSLFWRAAEYGLTVAMVECPLFLSRIGCYTDGTAQKIIVALMVVLMLAAAVLVFVTQPFISRAHTIASAGIGFAAGLTALLQFVRLLIGGGFDQDSVCLCAPVIIIATVISFRILSNRRILASAAALDLLQDEGEEFEAVIKRPSDIMRLYRCCFESAHPYLLTWELFVKGVVKWGKNCVLWEQYLRLVAIFPEQTVRLVGIMEETQPVSRTSIYFRGIRKVAKLIVLGRNRRILNALKRRLKSVGTLEKVAAEAETAYWTALSEGNVRALFGVCNQVVDQCVTIRGEYQRLICEFPNSGLVVKNYANFLRVVEYDLREAIVQEARAARLDESAYLEDPCHTCGLATFPQLPRSITPGSPGPADSLLSAIGRQTSDLTEADMEAMNAAQQQSSIRELGLTVGLSFVRNLRLFVIIHFLVICFLGMAVPYIPVRDELRSMDTTWSLLYQANIVTARIPEIELLIAVDTAYIAEVLLNSTGDVAVLGSIPFESSWIASQIEVRIADFLIALNSLQNSLGNIADTNLQSWTSFYTAPIEMVLPGSLTHYNISLGSALESVMSQLVSFDPVVSGDRISYSNATWLEGFQRNCWSLIPALLEYSTGLAADQMALSNDAEALLSDLIIVAAALNFFAGLVYVILLRSLWLKWRCVGRGLAQLPKSQIHACITRLSFRRSRSLVGDERLYYNDCVKLVSAAGGFGDLPMSHISLLVLVMVASSIMAVSMVDLSLGNQLVLANGIFTRATLLANMTAYMYHTATGLVLYMCLSSGSPKAYMPALGGISPEDIGMLLSSDLQDLTSIIDCTTLGSALGESFGMLGSPERQIAEALLGGEMRFERETTPHDFVKYAPYLLYIGMVHTGLTNPIFDILLVGPPYRDGFDLVMSTHYLVRHWSDDMQKVLEQVYVDCIRTATDKIGSDVTGPPAPLVALSLAAAVALLYFIGRIGRGLHFALSTLAMVSPEVVMESIPLTNFLTGIFPTNERAVVAESALCNAVTSIASEVTLQVRPDGVVTAVSPAIENRWGVRPSDCLDVDLSLILEFDPSVRDRLATNLNTEITLVSDRTPIPVNSYAFEVGRDGEVTAYVLFIEDLRQQRQAQAALEAEAERARELVAAVVPRTLSGKLTEANRSLTYVANWDAVMCVQLSEFGEFAKRLDAVEVLKRFRMEINDRLERVEDIAPLKSVGLSEYLLVNGADHWGNAAAAVPAIWSTCNALAAAAAALGLRLQFGVSGESQAVMGLMSTDDLSFDIFGRVLKAARALAKNAPVGSLNVDKMGFPMFPDVAGCAARPRTFKIGSLSYSALEIQLPRPVITEND
jgi:PAS domain-containing protein